MCAPAVSPRATRRRRDGAPQRPRIVRLLEKRRPDLSRGLAVPDAPHRRRRKPRLLLGRPSRKLGTVAVEGRERGIDGPLKPREKRKTNGR